MLICSDQDHLTHDSTLLADHARLTTRKTLQTPDNPMFGLDDGHRSEGHQTLRILNTSADFLQMHCKSSPINFKGRRLGGEKEVSNFLTKIL
jgi:hypothetical protein